MDIEDKAVAVVARLVRLTREGKLKWEQFDAAGVPYVGGQPLGLAYLALYEEKQIGVFEVSYKDFSEETDEWYVTSRVVIAILDDRRRIQWEFPKLRNAYDLLEAIQFQSAKVDDFFDRVLEKKTPRDE